MSKGYVYECIGVPWQYKIEDIRRRDNNTCAICSDQSEKLEVHHIYPQSRYVGLRYIDWNLITLCKKCHNDMHLEPYMNLSPKGKKLQERVKKQYDYWKENFESEFLLWFETAKKEQRGFQDKSNIEYREWRIAKRKEYREAYFQINKKYKEIGY